MRYGLFYQHQLFGDVLLIDLFPLIPDREEVFGRVHVLYAGKQIVGYNIFNVGEVVKIKAHGLIPLPSERLINVINSMLQSAGQVALPLLTDSGIHVGRITKVEPHPESEHLHVTQVDVGTESLTIVCGASNCQVGMVVPVAKIGAIMADGSRIEPTRMLGVDSFGMLCSARELGLSDTPGLLALEETMAIGSDFYAITGD